MEIAGGSDVHENVVETILRAQTFLIYYRKKMICGSF